jgi:hypothetical protein
MFREPDSAGVATESRARIRNSECDVVVVGGGLSGVCAAISAARHGVRTALVHDRPMLGGNSSSETGLVPEFHCWVTPWTKETGIIEELYAEGRRRNHEPWVEGRVNAMWDLTLYEAVRAEPNLILFLNASVREAEVDDEGRITAVRAAQIGTTDDVRLAASIFVDTTGTGALGYLAGADYVYGREGKAAYGESLQPDEPDEQTMGNTMYYRSRETLRPVSFEAPEWAAHYESDDSLGFYRSHSWPYCGYFWLEVGQPHDPMADVEAIRHELVGQVLGVWDHLKNRGDHRANSLALEWVSWIPYQRESRRLLGDYVLTQHDIQRSPHFDDAISFGAWPIDMHPPGGMLEAPEPTSFNHEFFMAFFEGVRPYSIPYRCLFSRNIRNLLMAGRVISCTYVAFSSTRILPTGALMGQAVGVAASLCVQNEVEPRDLQSGKLLTQLQQALLADDHFIPGLKNLDPFDLARGTSVTASSQAQLRFPPTKDWETLNARVAQLLPITANRIDTVRVLRRAAQGKE